MFDENGKRSWSVSTGHFPRHGIPANVSLVFAYTRASTAMRGRPITGGYVAVGVYDRPAHSPAHGDRYFCFFSRKDPQICLRAMRRAIWRPRIGPCFHLGATIGHRCPPRLRVSGGLSREMRGAPLATHRNPAHKKRFTARRLPRPWLTSTSLTITSARQTILLRLLLYHKLPSPLLFNTQFTLPPPPTHPPSPSHSPQRWRLPRAPPRRA